MSRDKKERKEAADPEVVPRAKRRNFSAEEKLRILEEADACEHGEIGALVRREGIYTSYLSRWRRERKRGELEGLSPKKRGPASEADKSLAEENEKLRRENKRLKERLAQAETIIEVQKKSHSCLVWRRRRQRAGTQGAHDRGGRGDGREVERIDGLSCTGRPPKHAVSSEKAQDALDPQADAAASLESRGEGGGASQAQQ